MFCSCSLFQIDEEVFTCFRFVFTCTLWKMQCGELSLPPYKTNCWHFGKYADSLCCSKLDWFHSQVCMKLQPVYLTQHTKTTNSAELSPKLSKSFSLPITHVRWVLLNQVISYSTYWLLLPLTDSEWQRVYPITCHVTFWKPNHLVGQKDGW